MNRKPGLELQQVKRWEEEEYVCRVAWRNIHDWVMACVFHGFLPPSPSEGCHSVHVNAATQSTGLLPPSPRERCHVDHGKVATHARRSLPPSEQRDAGSLLLV
jgi:hypothetical protein